MHINTNKCVIFLGLLNKVIRVRHPRCHTFCSIPPEANDVKPTSYHVSLCISNISKSNFMINISTKIRIHDCWEPAPRNRAAPSISLQVSGKKV